MELRNLTTFMKVAELQNFSQAAEELGYSQSAITVQIRQLENELGVRLFDRIGKNIVITQYGTEFMTYASEVLAAAGRAAAFACKNDTLKGSVCVGTVESMMTGVFSRIIPLFHGRFPLVDAILVDESVEALKERLDRNTVDLILTLDHPLADSRWVKLFEKKEEIVLVANPHHPLACKSRVYLENLAGEDFILMPPKNSYRDLFDTELARRNIGVAPFLELESTYTAIRLLRENLYLSVLPRYAVQNWVDGGQIVILPIEDCKMYEYMQLLHHKNKVITPQISGMLTTIQECLEGVD
ncbi:MAG: LysR family transcriptional regulator [Oscillospiraceae bacterium]|nr:LysR family transcriptional regulator [Oscillospiraceae bacterium]